ncbi:MAG TPA: hypothetical protein VGQ99_12555 [Tepidisphaeraceae bacterium]|jgi:hypothetical protein|nr:hypothetical protein [Tepidisphaeraceae bacterium]
MKSLTIFLTIAAVLSSLSCGGSNTSPTQTNQTQSSLTHSQNTQSTQRDTRNDKIQNEPIPNIPKDAEWTILCATVTGPDNATQARALRGNLINQTKMRDWYILHGAGQTTLYYGFYRSINDPKDTKESTRAQNDRKTIAALTDPASGARLFNTVILTKLDAPDPTSPPEWDLTRASGTYSLQVTVFKDSPDRRAAAVEAVRAARAQGYDAYYYHGPAASSVCIGAWPETAVRETNAFNVKQMPNPNAVPLVTAGSIPNLQPGEAGLMTPDGKPINVISAKFEILDPQLLAIMKQFPTHSVNGVERPVVVDPRTNQRHFAAARPSFLVRIPHTNTPPPPTIATAPDPTRAQPEQPLGPAVGAASAAGADQPPPQAPSAPRPSTSKGGKLRSLEDR